MLARRAHSIHELEQKLLLRGWPRADVAQVVDRLQLEGYLDDFEFAMQWADQRQRLKLYGPERVRLELKSKGVAMSIIEDVLAEVFADEGTIIETARRAIEKNMYRWTRVRGAARQRRLQNYLQRLGFRQEHIRKVIESRLTDFWSDG